MCSYANPTSNLNSTPKVASQQMQKEPIELKKRIEEVRLLESRRSARLADQDRVTDFAVLADMGGERRRATNSIEVPLPQTPQQNSRKRPQTDVHDDGSDSLEEMNACSAALILVNLSAPDKCLGSSPGSSSSASWSSGSASPPLSDDGHALHNHSILSPHDAASANARIRTTSVSTSDEGIVMDYKDDRCNKKFKKLRCTWKGCNCVEMTAAQIERHIRDKHLRKKARRSGDNDSCSENEHEEEFYYTDDDDDDESVKTPSPASPPTLSHRDMARPPHEDPEYQRQKVINFRQGRAMNYSQQQQQQPPHFSNNSRSLHHNNNGTVHITSTQQQQLQNNNTSLIPTSPLAHHNYTWPSNSAGAGTAIPVTATSTPTSGPPNQQQQPHHIKHPRSSSRPSHSAAPYPTSTYGHHQHHNYSSSGSSSSNNSSPIIHSNNSANNMLHQLSQQNVTVTAHHSGNGNSNGNANVSGQPHQQQHLSGVTITPNYHPSQQQQQPPQQQRQQTTASNIVANTGPNMPLQHVAVQHAVQHAAKHTPNSPSRRTRGENKKCRKVYGMERRDQWCTQCRWKKACSRFGD
ncbi:zinc finger protein 704 isoform X2 [Scaptodrosophila lebanonensis]|uniref:Zinc finger protein 704 isoform X2 n=1 Tax=Drosophila lebanonensis TaxID=7225 RepID=A0A6J2TNG0_DROLE|nr:zinc finger protein 704 isoform X2 [Scaptodrosophila lebanonensis]